MIELITRALEAARILWGKPVSLPPYSPEDTCVPEQQQD